MDEYRASWQKGYAETPYSKVTSELVDLSPQEYANVMIAVFEEVGILAKIKSEKCAVLGTSISSGEKDFALMDSLDSRLVGIPPELKPLFVLTDFAVSNTGRSVIRMPDKTFSNITVAPSAMDSYKLAFEDSTFTVIYERLGAMYHAADQDYQENTSGKNVEEMLAEYARVLRQDGIVIFDWINSRTDISTIDAIEAVVEDDSLEAFFSRMGFSVELAGQNESFFVLRKN